MTFQKDGGSGTDWNPQPVIENPVCSLEECAQRRVGKNVSTNSPVSELSNTLTVLVRLYYGCCFGKRWSTCWSTHFEACPGGWSISCPIKIILWTGHSRLARLEAIATYLIRWYCRPWSTIGSNQQLGNTLLRRDSGATKCGERVLTGFSRSSARLG